MKKILFFTFLLSLIGSTLFGAEKEVVTKSKNNFSFSTEKIILAQNTTPEDSKKNDQPQEEVKQDKNKKTVKPVDYNKMINLGTVMGYTGTGLFVFTWLAYFVSVLSAPLALGYAFHTPSDMWGRYIYPAVYTSWIPIGGPIAGAVIMFDLCNDSRTYFSDNYALNKGLYQAVGALLICASIFELLTLAMMISGYATAGYYKMQSKKAAFMNNVKFDIGYFQNESKEQFINFSFKVML